MRKGTILFLLSLIVMAAVAGSLAHAATTNQILSRWGKGQRFVNDMGANLTITCTYYSSEYISAYIEDEAQKNLWTASETEDFKFQFLNALKLNEYIPVMIKFVNNGPTMHLGPFDIMVKLAIKGKEYKPVDYDKRFNYSLQGEREGLVFFPRYDEKSGKDLLAGATTVRLSFNSAISPILDGKTPKFLWDVNKDDPSKLLTGTTAARIETGRLLKRLEKLRKDKAEEEAKLAAINGEISTIQTRLDELVKIQ